MTFFLQAKQLAAHHAVSSCDCCHVAVMISIFQRQFGLLKSLSLLQCAHHKEASQQQCQHPLPVGCTGRGGKELANRIRSSYNKGGKERSNLYSSGENKHSLTARSRGENCRVCCLENNGEFFLYCLKKWERGKERRKDDVVKDSAFHSIHKNFIK